MTTALPIGCTGPDPAKSAPMSMRCGMRPVVERNGLRYTGGGGTERCGLALGAGAGVFVGAERACAAVLVSKSRTTGPSTSVPAWAATRPRGSEWLADKGEGAAGDTLSANATAPPVTASAIMVRLDTRAAWRRCGRLRWRAAAGAVRAGADAGRAGAGAVRTGADAEGDADGAGRDFADAVRAGADAVRGGAQRAGFRCRAAVADTMNPWRERGALGFHPECRPSEVASDVQTLCGSGLRGHRR